MELEALIIQSQRNNQEVNDNLEALIVQTQKNDNKEELEAIAKANIDTKNVIKKSNKELINIVKKYISDIKFPEYSEQKLAEKLDEIKSELSKEQIVNIKLTLV